MDHRGHPKKPIHRDDLPLDSLVKSFLAETETEDESLAKKLKGLNDTGKLELAGILGRFDLKKSGALDAGQRLTVRRVLLRLRRIGDETLTLTNMILNYLDLNRDAIIDQSEMTLIVEVLELFAHADSDNDTLSPIELKMLYAVLRHIDTNNNGKLDPHEKEQLLQGLQDPAAFLEKQKATNPLLEKIS